MANQINLRILVPHGTKEDHFVGLFLSFLDAVSEVTEGTKKASFLTQFYKERLNKLERRLLSGALGQLLKQLSKMNEKEQLDESSQFHEDKIPKVIIDLFHSFSINEQFDFDDADFVSSGPLTGRAIERETTVSLKTGGKDE